MLSINVMYGVIIDCDDFFDIVLSDVKQNMDEPTKIKFRRGYCMMNNTLSPPDSLVDLVNSILPEDHPFHPDAIPFDVALIPHDQIEQRNKMVLGAGVILTDTQVDIAQTVASFEHSHHALISRLRRVVDRGQPNFHFVHIKCNCCYD